MDVEQNLNMVNESLKKINKNLQPTILEPAHLEWSPFLDKMNEICDQYGELITQLSPELKRTITFPTKFDVYDTNAQNNVISMLEPPADFVSEQKQYREMYKEFLEQAGLTDSPKEMRLNEIKNNIAAHNDAIAECQDQIRDTIEKTGLANISASDANSKQNQRPVFKMFDYMEVNEQYA